MLVGVSVRILLTLSCLMKKEVRGRDVPLMVIVPKVSRFYGWLYQVVLLLINSPLSIVEFMRSAKYTLKSHRVKTYDIMEVILAVTLWVKFEGELEEDIEMSPVNWLMLIKLMGLRDIELKEFSKVYLVLGPGTQLNSAVLTLNKN